MVTIEIALRGALAPAVAAALAASGGDALASLPVLGERGDGQGLTCVVPAERVEAVVCAVIGAARAEHRDAAAGMVLTITPGVAVRSE